MIPAYLLDLQLPQVFSAYSTTVDSYLLLSTSDEHIVDADVQKVSGFVTPHLARPKNLQVSTSQSRTRRDSHTHCFR